MAYNSAETRRRLLDAAFAEFSERGLAGARVDRIAAAASANKQAIYAYFGSKDGLFDAMLEDRLGDLADEVPFRPDDLPGYAGALFDHLAADPRLVRMSQWKDLERGDVAPVEADSYLGKARKLLAGPARGMDETTAVDLLLLVLSLCFTWATTAPAIRALGGLDETERLKRHRAAVVAAVEAVTTALTTGASDV